MDTINQFGESKSFTFITLLNSNTQNKILILEFINTFQKKLYRLGLSHPTSSLLMSKIDQNNRDGRGFHIIGGENKVSAVAYGRRLKKRKREGGGGGSS